MKLELVQNDENLVTTIKTLLPLTAPIATRYAFVAAGEDNWCAYFDNGRMGTDAATVMPVLARKIGCKAIRMVAVEGGQSVEGAEQLRYASRILEFYGPDGSTSRTLYAANDGGKWKFGQSGAPYKFEEIDKYSHKNICNRLTIEMIQKYLWAFGIKPFDQEWFSSSSWMLKKVGRLPASLQCYSLP